MNTLRHKITRNLSGYTYSQLITLGSQILVVPFFLSAWGVQKYGEWLVLTSIPTFLAMLELGVAEASATRASLASGSRDIVTIRKTIDTALAFSIITSLIVAILGTIIATTVPWTTYLKLTTIDLQSSKHIFIYMSLYLAGNFLAGPISAWLKSMDLTATSAFSMANRRAAEMVVIAISLLGGANPTTLAACLMITSFATTTIYYFIALHHSTIGAMSLSNADRKELYVVFWPAISFMALPLSQVATLQGGVLILNSLAGGATVAAFSMSRTMVRLLMQIGIVFNNAMRPEVSRLLGQNLEAKARKIVKKGSLTAAGIMLVGLCGVALFGSKILAIWSDGKVILSETFLVILALHAVINVLWYVPSTLLFAQNKHGNISWFYMAFSTISLFLWWLFSSKISALNGAALMMLLPELFMTGIVLTGLYQSQRKA